MLTPQGISAVEWATAMPLDLVSDSLPAPRPGDRFEQLLATVVPAVSRPPCVVHFTGDCGSCLVLHTATVAARRLGLPDPIAVTPDYGEAGGGVAPHQEPLVRELRLADWERPTVGAEVTDLLGPTALSLLDRFGLLYPCIVNAFTPPLELARGGSIIDGHGIDVMWTVWRGAPLAAALASRQSRRGYLSAAVALAPRRLRERAVRRVLEGRFNFPWLREDARRDYLDRAVAGLASSPLAFGRSLPLVHRQRCWRYWQESMQTVARASDVHLLYPIADPQMIANMAALGRVLGWPSPDALVRTFAPSLPARMRALPVRLGLVSYGERARAFAASWDGDSLDESIVDPSRVREAWRQRDVRAGGLLQSAWLSATGATSGDAPAPVAAMRRG